jgi:hypothetical protein
VEVGRFQIEAIGAESWKMAGTCPPLGLDRGSCGQYTLLSLRFALPIDSAPCFEMGPQSDG